MGVGRGWNPEKGLYGCVGAHVSIQKKNYWELWEWRRPITVRTVVIDERSSGVPEAKLSICEDTAVSQGKTHRRFIRRREDVNEKIIGEAGRW